MLLRQFRRGVHVPRVRRCVLADQTRRECCPAVGAAWLEPPGRQVVDPARSRAHRSVPLARVPALAVDHHRPGEDEFPDPAGRHLRQQDRRSEVVAANVLGGVGEVLPEADHRSLVTHRVHSAQRRPDRVGVAYVGSDERRVGQRWCVGVGGGQQGVEDDGLVPAVLEGGDDVGADEPGPSGDEYAHAGEATQYRPTGVSPTRGCKTSVIRERRQRRRGPRSPAR